MKKVLIQLFCILPVYLMAQYNSGALSHCSGIFYGSDITTSVIPTCDGSFNLISGSCTGACYDYFDIFLEAGESLVLSACASNGAVIPDPDFDIFFSIWTNSPYFDNQVACSDSDYSPDVIFQTACAGAGYYYGEYSQGTEIVFTAPADDIYRVELSDWVGSFNDGTYTIAVSCPGESIDGETVPTLSQWGLILFGLLLMSFGAIQLAVKNSKSLNWTSH